MKVAIVGPFPPPVNGCSYANEVLRNNLIKNGIKCRIINTNTDVISSRQGNTFSLDKAVSFFRTYFLLKKIPGCNIVYLTPGQTFFGVLKYAPFILACLSLQIPYIIHVHGNYLGNEYRQLSGYKKRIFQYLISKAAAGIVLSQSLKINFNELLPNEKIFIVKNFVHENLFSDKLICKKYDKPRILYLSNLMREKGIIELLDALIIFKDEIEFEAVIAGSIEDDVKKDVLQRLRQLNDKAIYVGVVEGAEKKRRFSEANIFVLPTYYKMEGQPIALLEALATGNIIITTRYAGIPDIINESNGFFVNIKSAHAIADCIKNISKNLLHYINLFSIPNSKYAEAKFREEIFTKRILAIMKQNAKA